MRNKIRRKRLLVPFKGENTIESKQNAVYYWDSAFEQRQIASPRSERILPLLDDKDAGCNKQNAANCTVEDIEPSRRLRLNQLAWNETT